MELKLPLDFQRLPEFRKLAYLLAQSLRPTTLASLVEVMALNLYVRLWVELGYLARGATQPGRITPQDEPLLRISLAGVVVAFGDDVDMMKLYHDAGLLTVAGNDWFCERFAQMNAHLAGGYKSREERGAAASALERNRNRIAHDANRQAMLLPPEFFNKRDGTRMNETEVNRCMVMIKTLDHCLKHPGRNKSDYTAGLISDANAAIEAQKAEDLRTFYIWLKLRREHPRIPQSAEKILADFEACFAMSQGAEVAV